MSQFEGTLDTTATLAKLKCPACGAGAESMVLTRRVRETEYVTFPGGEDLSSIQSMHYETDGWQLFCQGKPECRQNHTSHHTKLIEDGTITEEEWSDLCESADDCTYE